MTTAHVYGGSGFLMYAHLGAAQALYDYGHKPDLLVGTSGGSIVAGFLANGYEPKEALKFAKTILPKTFVKFNWKFFVEDHWGFFTLSKMEKILKKYVPEKFCNVKIPLYVVTTDVAKGKAFIFSTDDTPTFSIPRAIRASSSVPGLFDTVPVSECGVLLTDGGVVNNLAIDLQVVQDADEAFAVRLFSEEDRSQDKKPTNMAEFLIKVLGSMMSEIERKHIEDASDFSKVTTIRIPYGSMNFLGITPEKIQWMYDLGYKQMAKKLNEPEKDTVVQ
jgi:predicted acylesterase/phospholipase RssA